LISINGYSKYNYNEEKYKIRPLLEFKSTAEDKQPQRWNLIGILFSTRYLIMSGNIQDIFVIPSL